MSEARWWKGMVIVVTTLATVAVVTTAIPHESFRYFTTCTLHVNANVQALLFLGSLGLALPVILTFATAAVRNQGLPISQRIPWAIFLLLAWPLAVPCYWWSFLRESRP